MAKPTTLKRLQMFFTGESSATAPSAPWTMEGLGENHPLFEHFRKCGYDALYREQPSVRKVVNKLAALHNSVPFKVHQRTGDGERREAPLSSYGALVAQPSKRMSGFDFYSTLRHFYYLYDNAFALKQRDGMGRTESMEPVHPLRMRWGKPTGRHVLAPRAALCPEEIESGCGWWYKVDLHTEVQVPRSELFIWKGFNPESTKVGLSRLEALRATLSDDGAARLAMERMWVAGARPLQVIQTADDLRDHPAIIQQIKDKVMAAHGGVANWYEPLVLDGGVDIKELRMEKGLEYLGLRQLTDVEVAATYDLTGPAVHILDRATFNNIEALLREVYKTTMQPHLLGFEACWDFDVRDGRHGRADIAPQWGTSFRAEHNVKGVLAGSPEQQIEAGATQIQTGQRTINELRQMDNLPPVDGGDVLLVNAALIPVAEAGRAGPVDVPTAATLEAGAPRMELPATTGATGQRASSIVLGHVGRIGADGDVAELDPDKITGKLASTAASVVRSILSEAVEDSWTCAQLRESIKESDLS